MAGSIDLNELMMCPLVAAELGWNSDPNDALTFTDKNDEPVAFTQYWRDGGFASRETDTSIRREGYMVLVRADHLSQLSQYFTGNYEVRAWRRFQKFENDDSMFRSDHRQESPPVTPAP
jgi:hypothetical protein